jgi:hypothetical protein
MQDEQREGKRNTSRWVPESSSLYLQEGWSEPSTGLIGNLKSKRNQDGSDSSQETNQQNDNAQKSVDEIVTNDCRETADSKQLNYCLCCLNIAITIQSNINEGPLIEIFNKSLNVQEDAFRNAPQDSRATIVGCTTQHATHNLKNSDNKGTKADGTQ